MTCASGRGWPAESSAGRVTIEMRIFCVTSMSMSTSLS
jgi:hypothetical protein